MKLPLKILLAIVPLSLLAVFAAVQDWLSSSTAAYLIFFVAFMALAVWIFSSVLNKDKRHRENLIACPACKMRTDSQRDECMWCDQGLSGS
ncbi:hypothetical protein ACO0LF_09310 [Undibacterium sp. Di27W]|uniref:hypothetical protein n=1 Tax=Undibacterium sp. Di27W TaxID=3413036 RepID=UPI003BF42DA0